MDERLEMGCEWWGPSGGAGDVFDSCRGAIGIRVGEVFLTHLEDSWGNTVRNRVNASAYTLAAWLAGNWWRLRWEPETRSSRDDMDWRMSHSMASAGDGFCWPSIVFASDGDSIAISSRATRGRVLGPVRYLAEVHARVSAMEFERAVDAFLTLVLSRLHAEGHGRSELSEIWGQVGMERRDPDLAVRRRLEALCGFDAGEAPESLVDAMVGDRGGLGRAAMEEVAAEGRHSTGALLDSIHGLAETADGPGHGGFRGIMPRLKTRPEIPPGLRPWQTAARFARSARGEWGLGEGPLTSHAMAELLHTSPALFDGGTRGTTPMALGLRDVGGGPVTLYLNRSHPTSRRFAVGRLIGDVLLQPGDGRLIPATSARTARQQFQRAFAQELLCPFNALIQRVPSGQPDEDDIADAAAYFGVSTRLVEATLVNRGELDREALDWTR